MAIVRWDPFDTLLSTQDDLNRLFRGWLRGGSSILEGGKWSPAVDMYETEDALVVEAELPGIDPKDIDVSVEGGVLVINGERKHEKEVNEENYHRVERAYGSFERAIQLPSDVDPDKIKASYENGVLKALIPKKEVQKPKSIPITVEAQKK
ncbi:MAG: Hsp20/alpha crystallin family protein [Actinomycetota bacterium]|nr:Hsp20/alpha crystallin family protein [Actinomycetota bacterium]